MRGGIMNKYFEHYWKIEKYKQNFDKMLRALVAADNPEMKLELALYAADYFVYHNGGYYTSAVLEKYFVDLAKSIKVDLSNIKYKEKSVLHVLTQGYKTGGHTRVVERWIKNAPDIQIHSVVQIRENNAKLTVLENCVKEKNGQFISFDNNLSLNEKAVKLRKLAMEYEYVILHTHMGDPTAAVAFGTEDFTRPVLFYNHASHMPWIGKSVADLVLDIEKDDPVTTKKRGINNTYFLGVPSKEIFISPADNKKQIREKLNLPIDKKIIVICGREARFRRIAGRSFTDYLNKIMDDNTCCYVIGIKSNSEEWQKSIKKSGKNINLLGIIDFNNGFLDYLKSADLYLDSYPLCSGTATIDAISSGTPALSLQSVYPQFDYFTRTSAYCKSEEEFIEKAKKILNDENYAKEIYEELKASLIEFQSIGAWNKKIERLFEIAPKKHKVKDLSNETDYAEPNDLSVLCNTIIDNNFLKLKNIKLLSNNDITAIMEHGNLYKTQGVPFIFQVLSYKKSGKKIKVFKLFGIKIHQYVKK